MKEPMQKPIRIFTPYNEFIAEISNYESLMFTRSWSGIGDLELRINRYKKYTDKLQKRNIIVIGDDRHKAYLILHKEIELNEQGKATENWLIKALELKIVMGEKLTLPPLHTAYDNKQGPAETVMKHYINNNVINPIDIRRKNPQLLMATDLKRGITVNWQSRFKNLGEELTEISLLSGIGWNVSMDYSQKKWISDVLEGRNLSANQNIHSPVIFSPQFDNIQNMSFVDSDLNYRNVAYVAGQGEGVERRVIEVGKAEGLFRFETFVDARDIEETMEIEVPDGEGGTTTETVPRPEKDIIKDLTDRGNQQLAQLTQEHYLEGQIITHSNYKYEEDYDLGDIVTLQNRDWGVTLDARITEIKEIYEVGSPFQIEATFGNNRPTILKKIKQSLAQMSGEVRK
ncbi:siphovirus ReqiPepy6 Gp37-like family protein [Heyndrickxia oleronia]|uniref:siphovirus ReqiPepy6 Gp37-like family protein n=1 Tax=Heyndrickxia oleronia TaxID=38875 RepID=UPI002041C042|nr:siphovirus ReqiPepy6 Gp37-like family protein [Heyndrickxia oleronia]MCM3456541.1 siphovirus ReqiPepy6 Gp37-like family protein [Heyndrickxia oleronia]